MRVFVIVTKGRIAVCENHNNETITRLTNEVLAGELSELIYQAADRGEVRKSIGVRVAMVDTIK